MGQEFFLRIPTVLGLQGAPEIMPTQINGTSTTGNKQVDFVSNLYQIAVKVGKKFGIHPLIILAQASIESGWGTSLLSKMNNNFFGVTAFGKPNEYWNGDFRVSKVSGLKFRSYKTVEDGFSDFARIITTYYKQAAQVSNNVLEYAKKIAYSPYISEKNGDNRIKYQQLIIRSADTIKEIAKKKDQPNLN
ncbi:MAG TPA: glucosaminidase domain-containing protein [Bacteroidia bacterium]|jgi:flagellum-specific peptidoglycan hydrolase FlgJ|nr:glucosaminidase domain-containing protein [Bacteroidia bacterium]